MYPYDTADAGNDRLSEPKRKIGAVPGLQGVKRRVLHLILFELFAILLSAVCLALYSGADAFYVGFAATVSSAIAVTWNFIYNIAFEAWESRQHVKGRSLRRRAVHAIGFEIGLTAALVPLFAWSLGVSLLEAFVLDLGLILFFLVYTFAFNLTFDRLFGLPLSALARPQA